MGTITNLSLSRYRKFLKQIGCECVGINGGHEKWRKDGLLRPVIVQTHIDLVTPFVLKNALRELNISTADFLKIIKDIK